MGKPLSRPDCLRRNPTCLGKGEDEDGYIEDCYVPQRSIYDTMRINEQIDQGSKLNQTSKSTMEKMEGSTISSNGTLGAASNVFESRAPEGKKLDERIIFDALKLSNDVQKSAPVPPRRRPNAERKDNVNRRSWKSFMPPNFPEFAERMEASLSEVSEAGASNPSLQEKKESSSALTESSGHLDHREQPQSESVTLEHVSKCMALPEVQDVKNGNGDCQDFRFQQHSESSPHEFQPLVSEAASASGNTDVMQEYRYSSATWPRAMKSSAKGGFSGKQHPLGDPVCTVEMPPLSPCLSEELLDPALPILITASLREKTESELKFEEDERWIMMEAEEEWEEEKLSETGGKTFLMADEKNSLADIFEEREQANTVAMVEAGTDCLAAVLGTFDHVAIDQISCSEDSQPAGDQLASSPKDIPLDCSCVFAGEGSVDEMKTRTVQELEDLVLELECPVDAEQFSDTDSVQMFLELEKECLCEGVTPSDELQNEASSEGLASSQNAENTLTISHFSGAALDKEQNTDLLNIKVKDHDIGLDCKYINTLDSSQVPNAVEFTAYPDIRDICKDCEKVPFNLESVGKYKSPGDLESLGELDTIGFLNSDHNTSCEEKLSFASEVVKENGNLSQVECSQNEGNVEENIERFSLSFAFRSELRDVTSRPEIEVLSSDSSLVTGEIHLESEKEAIDKENSNVMCLGNADSCVLSTEKICDEDSEAKELDYQAKLWRSGGFPEQIFQDLQRKSLEAEVPGLHLLTGELRHRRDGVETMSDKKPELDLASSQREEMEMRDSDSCLNVFPEEQVTKASNTEPVLEEWTSNQQIRALTVTEPTLEDISVIAVSASKGPAISAAAIETSVEDIPVASVATIDTCIPATEVVTLEEEVTAVQILASERAAPLTIAVTAPEAPLPAAVVSSLVKTALAAAAAITEEDMSAFAESFLERTTSTATVPIAGEDDTPEGLGTLAASGPIPEDPDSPVDTVCEPDPSGPTATEETALPALAGPTTPEELVASNTAGPTTPEKPAALTLAGPSTPEKPNALAVAVPSPEELFTESDAEDCATPAPSEPTPTKPVSVFTPEGPAIPAAAVPPLEEVFTTGEPFQGSTAQTDSVPFSEEGTSFHEEASLTEMRIKEDLDSSAFGIKEVTGTALHEKVPLAATDGLNSNEVIVHFAARKDLKSKVRFTRTLTWC
ncbi:PREDICTED: uncharacterized protein KIAA0754 homolog [Dipodomys ordii]|uniref:Uncharacterized protein KIAA0754 homolog n=1 Tax=Dipodomys ordii TaxID=10020 RepID=A0A1S3F6S3_DIPOR|nr:PREDICTED: uncharacterized protein KIAA0754 homolog [Dipodomys ordii]